jgi:hypothetical protein
MIPDKLISMLVRRLLREGGQSKQLAVRILVAVLSATIIILSYLAEDGDEKGLEKVPREELSFISEESNFRRTLQR